MQAVSLRDARALLEIACAIDYDTERGFAPEGLTALCELLAADWVCYCETPIGAARHTVKNEVETRPFVGHNHDLETIFWAHLDEYLLGCLPTPDDGVLLMVDATSERAWRRTAFYNEWCREVHIKPQAKIGLNSAGSRASRCLMIDLADDAGRTFGDRERTLLKLAQPLFAQPIALADTTAQRRRALGLTPRELEVLGLVRHGLTNGEIATKLFVSPGTIRTHLENAFGKLAAHTRTEAIARLDELGRPARAKRAVAVNRAVGLGSSGP
jgi:DNA-binding CsgD family transcriptional regulator